MSDLLWQGLMISLTGMGLTFAVLGLLILTMMLLERFSRNRPELPEQEVAADGALARNPADEEVTAAIIATLAYFHAHDGYQNGLGATLEAGPGSWWKTGRPQPQRLPPLLRERHGETNHESEL